MANDIQNSFQFSRSKNFLHMEKVRSVLKLGLTFHTNLAFMKDQS